jgi:hypothetical protein
MFSGKWIVYKLSCYVLAISSLLAIVWFFILFFREPNPGVGVIQNTVLVTAVFGVIGSFQILALSAMKSDLRKSEMILRKYGWKYNLLLIGSFVMLFLLLVADLQVVTELRRDWDRIVANGFDIMIYFGTLLYTLILMYNLLASIFFRKSLGKEVRNNEDMISLIGIK